MDINAIKINQKNPRFIKNDNFYKLVKSVKEFPAMLKYRPIIVDNDNIIIGGNMRYLALKELGYTEIKDEWVKKASEFTAEEIKRFIIEDNLQFGEWDWDIIVDEGWNIDELIDWGMEMKRFKKIEGYEKENQGIFDKIDWSGGKLNFKQLNRNLYTKMLSKINGN